MSEWIDVKHSAFPPTKSNGRPNLLLFLLVLTCSLFPHHPHLLANLLVLKRTLLLLHFLAHLLQFLTAITIL